MQVWNSADPEAKGSAVILTALGTLTGSDSRFESAMPKDTVLVHLMRGEQVSAVLSLTRDLFESAERLDDDRLEITFTGALLGVYAS